MKTAWSRNRLQLISKIRKNHQTLIFEFTQMDGASNQQHGEEEFMDLRF